MTTPKVIKNLFGVETSSEDTPYAEVQPTGMDKIKLPAYLTPLSKEAKRVVPVVLKSIITGRDPEKIIAEDKDLARIGSKVIKAIPRIVTDTAETLYSEGDMKERFKDTARIMYSGMDKIYTSALGLEPEDITDPETGKTLPMSTTTGMVLDIGVMLATGVRLYAELGKVALKNKEVRRGMLSGVATSQLLMEPEENIANLIGDVNFLEHGQIKDLPYVGAAIEFLSADEDDPALLKRAKMGMTDLVFELGIVGTLKAVGFFGKPVVQYSKDMFNKDLKDLDKDEVNELFEVLLLKGRDETQVRPPKKEADIKTARQDTAEGVAQIVKQTTEGKSLFSKASSFLYNIKQRYFTSRGYLTKEAYRLKQSTEWGSRSLTGEAEGIAVRLQYQIDDFVESYDGDLLGNIAKALETKIPAKIKPADRLDYLKKEFDLPQQVAYEVAQGRELLDKLSKEILDTGIGSEVLRSTIADNLGSYLRRSYKAFNDKSYVPSAKATEDVVDLIEGSYIKQTYSKIEIEEGLDPEQIYKARRYAELEVENLLVNLKGKDFYEHIGQVMKVNSNLLKGREEIPLEIRKFLGEYDSPSMDILMSANKLINIVQTNKYYNGILELGGSSPKNKDTFKLAQDKVRKEWAEMDVLELKQTFDIDIPKGEYLTIDGKLGRFSKINKAGEYEIDFKNSKTGEVTTEKINPLSTKITLLPRDEVLDKVASKYYKEMGGTYTKAQYIFKQEDGAPNRKLVKIENTGSDLDGQWTSPEMAATLQNLEGTFALNAGLRNSSFMQGWRSIKGVSQQMKTVWDHTTQLRNGFGGVNFSLNNGILPFKNGKTTFKTLQNQLGDMDSEGFTKVYNRLRELGVINTSVKAGEWQSLMKGADDLSPVEFTDTLTRWFTSLDNTIDNTVKKVGVTDNVDPTSPWLSGSKIKGKGDRVGRNPLDLPQKFYMATDDFFKMNGFATELDWLRKAHPEKSLDELVEDAADIVRNTFPNYDMIPNGIKAIRDLPFGNFVAFTPEIIRTQLKIGMQAIKELSSGNKVLMQRGAARLAGSTAVNGAWAGAGTFAYQKSTISDRQEEGLQVLAESPWSKKHNKIFLEVAGNFYYTDPTHLNPYDWFPSIYQNAQAAFVKGEFKGEDFKKQLLNAAFNSAADSVAFATDTSLSAKFLADLWYAYQDDKGRTSKGQEVFKKGNKDIDSVVLGITQFAFDTVAPGFIGDATKLRDAMFQVPNKKTGRIESAGLKLLEFFTGFNFKKLVPEEILELKGTQYFSNLSYRLNKAGKPPEYKKDIAPTKFANWFNDIAKEQSERFEYTQDFYYQIDAFRKVGLTDNKIQKVLINETGLNKKQVNELLTGKFNPMEVPKKYMEDAERIFGKDHEGFRYLRAYMKGISNVSLNPTSDNYLLPVQNVRTKKVQGIKQGSSQFLALGFNLMYPKVKERVDENSRNSKTGRFFYETGGVVDVPNAPEEPDERIDKLTGLPYNAQAGEAYIDEEDPLRRLGFASGGGVDPLVRLGFAKGGEAQSLLGKVTAALKRMLSFKKPSGTLAALKNIGAVATKDPSDIQVRQQGGRFSADYDGRNLEMSKEIQNKIDRKFATEIVEVNKNIPFINRMVDKDNPNYEKAITIKQGKETHRMANRGNFAYPTIFVNPKTNKLEKLTEDAAFKKAMQTGEFIEFDNDKQAAWFATNNYKKAQQVQDYFKSKEPEKVYVETFGTGDIRPEIKVNADLNLKTQNPVEDMLAKLIFAEAENQTEQGQIFVARSIRNRHKVLNELDRPNSTYNLKPNDVSDYISIINADKQYSPVSDGRINKEISKENLNAMKKNWAIATDDNAYKQYLIDNKISKKDIPVLMNITGFRTPDADFDPSQDVNTYQYKDHIFNTAGYPEPVKEK